jgi:hypothetical protein
MKQVTIFQFIRNPRDYSKITGKRVLRIINVHPSFVGIGTDDNINKSEFRKLANDLEPTNDGCDVQ